MALTTYHAVAHQLHRLGFNVTAIEPGKKKPWHIWDAWQETRQTLDDLNGFPWRNAGGIGVISGIGGYHGFDFDKCGDFGPVATVLQKLELPTSYPWVWQSGSGNGYGLAVLCFEDLPSGILATNGAGPGVFKAIGNGFDHLELRWERCQTLVPPSRHPTGPGYVWINGEPTEPPATVTPWAIIAAFHAVTVAPTPKIAPTPKVAPASGNFTPTDDYLTAERNLERLAAWRCDDYDEWVHVGMALSELGNEGFELWDAWSRGSAKYDADSMPRKWASFKPGDGYTLASLTYWANQDNPPMPRPVATYRDVPEEPPWPANEDDPTPAHAPEPTEVKLPVMMTHRMEADLRTLGYGQAEIDALTPEQAWAKIQGKEAAPAATIGTPTASTPTKTAKKESPKLEVLSIRDLLTRTWPEPAWAVPGLLPVGLTVLAGRPKIGKSWLALQLVQSVTTGGVFLGRKVECGSCLYLALEDPPRRLAERAKLQGWQDLDAHADFVTVGSFRRGDGRQLAGIIREKGYRLVIVDTLARAFTGDKNSGDDMTAQLTPIQEAAHAGNCAVLLIHHFNKLGAATTGTADGITEPDPLVNLQGSISIGGMADCIMGLYRQADKRGILLTGYGRDVEEYSLNLVFDRTTHAWQATDADAPKVTDERAQILDAITERGASTFTEIHALVKGDRGNLSKRLANMVNLGMLDKDAKGRYSVPEV